jgi:hypothetical protein
MFRYELGEQIIELVLLELAPYGSRHVLTERSGANAATDLPWE